MTTDIAFLIACLSQHRLLDPKQLEELRSIPITDPNALANELIQRGWLTAFQAKILLQGKSEQLILGQHIILDRIGEGGMGQVFKAKHRSLGRTCAIKVIHKERLDNPEAVRRFQREVRAAAQLNHPNVVVAYDADEINGRHILVMEYIEGATDLSQLVKKHGPAPIAQACEYIRQAALGLQHAHEKGMVHRDIKPGNLILTADGKTVKILDMGLARIDQGNADDKSSTTLTQEGSVMGTPDYIAPEQAEDSHTVDIRADIYSLGCTLYYLLAGRVPFPSGSLAEKLLKHVLDDPQPVEQLRPDVPSGVAVVVRKMMAKKPEERYQIPAEVAGVLTSWTGQDVSSTEVASRPIASLPVPSGDTAPGWSSIVEAAVAGDDRTPPVEPFQKPSWFWPGVVSGVLVVIGVAVVVLLQQKSWQSTEMPKGKPSVTEPEKDEGKQVVKKAMPDSEKTVDNEIASARKEGNKDKLLALYRKQIEANWPGLGNRLNMNKDGTCTFSGGGQVTDLTALKGIPLNKLDLHRKGKVSDLTPLQGMPLAWLDLVGHDQVRDLSPLKGMPLTQLDLCDCRQVSDLSTLRGTRLTWLSIIQCPVSDLSPLAGMPISQLALANSKVGDLTPLKGMPLKGLWLEGTQVTDLTPLEGMELEGISITPKRITKGMETVEKMNSLKVIGTNWSGGKLTAEEFWKKYKAGEFNK